MGINLGAQFLPIALATMVAYYVQSVVSQWEWTKKRKTKSFNELHSSSNDVPDDFQSPAGVDFCLFISALIQILQSWIPKYLYSSKN